MTKLVVLRLEGDLSKEVQVRLEIGEEGTRASIEKVGHLPPANNLLQDYNEWKVYYRSCTATRLTPEAIIIDNTPEKCLEKAKLVKRRLNQWLRTSRFIPIREKYIGHVKREEEVRVLIRTNSDSLRKLPWQLWDLISDYPKAEVALSSTEHDQLVFDNRPRGRKEIKILAILGDSTEINVNEDRQVLENLPYTKTTFLVEPTMEEISKYLWEGKSYDILCFSGHSQSEGKKGRIKINKNDSITIDQLRYGLEKLVRNGLQMAIFNSCDGLGLVWTLQSLQIPHLIVMREPVPDLVAQNYLQYLLHALIIDNQDLYLAQRTARQRVKEVLEQDFPCASWLPTSFQHPSAIALTRDRLLGLSSKMHKERQSQHVERPKEIIKVCNYCGATNPDASNYCLDCGRALTDAVLKSPLPSTMLPNRRIPDTTALLRAQEDTVVAPPSQAQQQIADSNNLGSLYHQRKADILFVLDCTGSMQGEINAVRDAITDFVDTISSDAVRARVGLIEFRDRLIGEEQRVHLFDGEPFTNNPALFRQQISRLKASGGGDEPESSLDALLLALNQPFDASANKVIVLITDAPPHIPDVDVKSINEVVEKMRDINVDQVYLVIRTSNPQSCQVYLKLLEGRRGMAFDIGQGDDFRVRAEHFKQNLMQLGKTISAATRQCEQYISMKCPRCKSTQISKNGHYQGKQNYICKQCRHQFV